MVRCKFTCISKTQTVNGYEVSFQPVMSGSKENDAFFKWTPYGSIKFGTLSEEAVKQFEVGKSYYVDLTPSE